jgi:hypothetical protein
VLGNKIKPVRESLTGWRAVGELFSSALRWMAGRFAISSAR